MKREYIKPRIYDAKGITEHLSEMAAKGWKLKESGSFLWSYEKAEPENVRFCLKYDRENTEEISEDWKYVSTYSGIRIYRSEKPEAAVVEEDNEKRFLAMNALVQKKVAKPLMTSIGLFQFLFVLFGFECIRYPLDNLAQRTQVALLVLLPIFLIYSIWELMKTRSWSKAAKTAVREGKEIPQVNTLFFRRLDMALCTICALLLALLIIDPAGSNGAENRLIAIAVIVFLFLTIWISSRMEDRLAQKGASSRKIFGMKLLMAAGLIVMLIILTAIVVAWELILGDNDGLSEEAPVSAAQLGMVEEITEEDADYSVEESILMKKVSVYEFVDEPEYVYMDIYAARVKCGCLLDWCLERTMKATDAQWKAEEDSAWNADRVYFCLDPVDDETRWLVIKDDIILFVYLSEVPTNQQKRIISEKMMKAAE